MKHFINLLIFTAILFATKTSAFGEEVYNVPGLSVKELSMSHVADKINVEVLFDLKKIQVKTNDALILIPALIKGERKKEMNPVTIYGRNNWIFNERDNRIPIEGYNEVSVKYNGRPELLEYNDSFDYQNWMEEAQFVVFTRTMDCCNTTPLTSSNTLAYFKSERDEDEEMMEIIEYKPRLRYIRPIAEPEKERQMSGSAYIDFPLNSITLDPSYKNNSTELAKITASIDSVKNDIDIDLQSIQIIGYASPEGNYEVNAELAQGRTKALEDYVENLYKFDSSFIQAKSVAENWEGLRNYLVKSNLPNRWNIINIIDNSELDPDAKDWRIKMNYPDTYNYLLNNVFPSLRCTDYKINYIVTGYDDVRTIKYIMETFPQKLSLNEMFLLAQTYEPGSEDFNNIFETAARMFPTNDIANVNAANAAMSRGELLSAEKYLEKAGMSAEAMYARGMLAGLKGDKITAIKYLRKAGRMGLDDTDVVIEYLHTIK